MVIRYAQPFHAALNSAQGINKPSQVGSMFKYEKGVSWMFNMHIFSAIEMISIALAFSLENIFFIILLYSILILLHGPI